MPVWEMLKFVIIGILFYLLYLKIDYEQPV